jgi:hypothetical protein
MVTDAEVQVDALQWLPARLCASGVAAQQRWLGAVDATAEYSRPPKSVMNYQSL